MRFTTCLLLLWLIPICTIGQQNNILSGFVFDEETGEILINATIYDASLHIVTTTNNYGYYSLKLPARKKLELNISYVGYESQTTNIQFTNDTLLNFSLIPKENIIDEVIVTREQKSYSDRIELGTVDIPIKEIKQLPSLSGEPDIMKAYQLMPGISQGVEGKSGLYVRGGSPDQNLIMIDDIPLYYVNHLGGFVSVFNDEAIKNIKMYKGGYPANYGGRLSSVMDIRMKDGSSKDLKGVASIGLLTTKFQIEGPVKNENTTYLLSARRFMYDLLMKPFTKIVENVSLGYTFYDINAKINHKFSDKDRIYLSFYTGDDKITAKVDEKSDEEMEVKNKTAWGNLAGSFRWNHIYSSSLFSNLTYYYTRYRYQITYNYNYTSDEQYTYNNIFYSGINDQCLKYDFDYYPLPELNIKFGLCSVFHQFSPGKKSYQIEENNSVVFDSVYNNTRYSSCENALYVLGETKLFRQLGINAGVRFSNYIVNSETYNAFEPRLLLNYRTKNGLAYKLAFTKMQQYVHLLSNSGLGMPSDLWVLSTEEIPPQQSNQFSFGLAKYIWKQKFDFSVEAYFKESSNLIDYEEGASLLSGSNIWSEKVEIGGSGTSYGLELLLQKKTGKTTGWTGLTVSRATRQFDNINNGNSYLYSYDRLIDYSIVVNHSLKDNIKISATWVFKTGTPLTLPIGYYTAINENDDLGDVGTGYNYNSLVEIYEGKNTFRAKPYHKLDLGIQFFKQKKHGTRIFQISIYNAYCHMNPYYYFTDTVSGDSSYGDQALVIKQKSYFPIIPSASYSFVF